MKTELAVFGIIAVFVVVMTLALNVPQTQERAALPNLGEAPELTGIAGWINSEPLRIEDLKGKVVLIDFWTYSCINCIRTLPYLKDWHEKYSGKGLVIIGVHTPEFEFEKDYNNVRAAVQKYGIRYAVAQDNNYATWRAYNNKYWPRKYIVDKEGNIRYDHIGEGAYEETEKVIQKLLRESNPDVSVSNMTNITSDVDFSQIETPELYLGYQFARAPLGNSEGFSPGNIVEYRPESIGAANTVYLSGKWMNEADRIIAVSDSGLFLVYKAKDVNIVAGGNAISVFVDDVPATGRDATNGRAIIREQRLYNIVSGKNYGPRLLEIQAEPGFELYAFTFG